jgi:hypothetical protein
MGLETRSGGNITYLKVMGGKLVKKCKSASEEGAVKRVNKNGDDVYEKYYDKVSGSLTGAEVKETKDFGKFLELNLIDGDNSYNVSMALKSGYAQKLMYRFPNVDLSKVFKIAPYDFTNNEGKRNVGVTLYQDGVKIDPKWTKDNPGKMPSPEQKEFDGEMKWDYGKVNKFLVKAFEHHLTSMPAPKVEEAVLEMEEEDDDLPF